MSILLTGAKSAQAFKVLKALEGEDVILADYGDTPAFPSKAYAIVSLGPLNKDVTAHVLLTSCLDHGVNAILPLYDFELEAVNKSITLFEEFGISILQPSAYVR